MLSNLLQHVRPGVVEHELVVLDEHGGSAGGVREPGRVRARHTDGAARQQRGAARPALGALLVVPRLQVGVRLLPLVLRARRLEVRGERPLAHPLLGADAQGARHLAQQAGRRQPRRQPPTCAVTRLIDRKIILCAIGQNFPCVIKLWKMNLFERFPL